MKLFYSNGSCSLASHITLEEAGAKFEAVRVDLRAGEQKKPEYLAINPKAKVPALVVDAGVITENPAIMSYVADTHPQAKLLAAPGDFARAKAQEWLAWCASTVHRDFSPLFRDKDNADQLKLVQGHLDQLDAWLKGPYVLGETFSIADSYTLVFTLWAGKFGLNVGPKMRASAKALLQRPGVQRAVQTQQLKIETH
ncbi:MAG TPA: glutathione S-transferase N-terminal domain-containing protein [Polyangia bacterium]|nr:glutathione S-transferase N-terminal domain-containing protein [Polyangia bacterium]